MLDFYEKDKNSVYYIGTLVTYKRGDNLFEVIDGQQRLTTIYLILKSLDVEITNKLSYSARQISKLTIEKLPELPELYDEGIKNGFDYTKAAINNIVGEKKEEFKKYFLDKVRIIYYQVPKDVDLNHYFEVMNSRGEQLEKHEIIKARLCKDMNANEMTVFSTIWEACSYMNCYIQQKYQNENLFGKKYDDILNYDIFIERSETKKDNYCKISDLLNVKERKQPENKNEEVQDGFQSIIDFPNFLLIVLKLTLILQNDNFNPEEFILDDKELVNEFDRWLQTIPGKSSEKSKLFLQNLAKAKYFLDNYIVHHNNSEKGESG